jgi:hypothetical protein
MTSRASPLYNALPLWREFSRNDSGLCWTMQLTKIHARVHVTLAGMAHVTWQRMRRLVVPLHRQTVVIPWVEVASYTKFYSESSPLFANNLWNWPWILMWSARHPIFPQVLDPPLEIEGGIRLKKRYGLGFCPRPPLPVIVQIVPRPFVNAPYWAKFDRILELKKIWWAKTEGMKNKQLVAINEQLNVLHFLTVNFQKYAN